MEINTEFQKPQQEQPKPESRSLKATEIGWRQRLKDKFNQVLGREKKQAEPQIEVEIFFAPHKTVKDLEGFSKRFASCDIYIPEGFGWSMADLEFEKNVSFGKGKLQELINSREGELGIEFSSRRVKELEIIYNSNKPIAFIDIPDSYPDVDKFREHVYEYSPPFTGNFSEVLDYTEDFMGRWGDDNLDREKYWLSQFKPRIQELLEEYPWLKKRRKLRVLLSLGWIHTSFHHILKNSEEGVSRSFRNMPTIYSFSGEALRRYMFGRKITSELVAKDFLESIVFGNPLRTSMELVEADSARLERFQRKTISQFSFEEAKEVFEGIKQKTLELRKSSINRAELVAQTLLYISAWFHHKLEEKGMKVPQTEKELDEFLARPLPSSDKIQE